MPPPNAQPVQAPNIQNLLQAAEVLPKCMERALDGTVTLFWSEYVLEEIRRIPEKPTPRRLGVTADRVESLIARLISVAHLVERIPSIYQHPIDPKDSHYVDLAIASNAKLIVSRDKHLLNLMNPAKPIARQFKATFPHLAVLQPEQLLELIRQIPSGEDK